MRIEVDLEGDGEPSQDITLKTGPGRGGRYWRGVRWKPTVNGTWALVIRAWDLFGKMGETRCLPGVAVTF